MKLKEFLMPDWKKIVLTIALFLILNAIYLIFISPQDIAGYGGLFVFYFFMLPLIYWALSTENIIIMTIIGYLSPILLVLFWYLIACVLIFIFNQIKKIKLPKPKIPKIKIPKIKINVRLLLLLVIVMISAAVFIRVVLPRSYLEAAANNEIENLDRSCETDLDCTNKGNVLDCPFGCSLCVNKDADTTLLEAYIKLYGLYGGVCFERCAPVKKCGCINNICTIPY